MAKLIFLDIDGVLDTYKSRCMLDPMLMDKLGIILGKTGAGSSFLHHGAATTSRTLSNS